MRSGFGQYEVLKPPNPRLCPPHQERASIELAWRVTIGPKHMSESPESDSKRGESCAHSLEVRGRLVHLTHGGGVFAELNGVVGRDGLHARGLRRER